MKLAGVVLLQSESNFQWGDTHGSFACIRAHVHCALEQSVDRNRVARIKDVEEDFVRMRAGLMHVDHRLRLAAVLIRGA